MEFKIWINEARKQDFFALAGEQRDKPEHAMLTVQRTLGGGPMSVTAEHVGDLIHRMSEEPTFRSAGYEYVKEKVVKCLHWLKNPYFARELEGNIISGAKYYGVDEEKHRQKVYAALENYAQEHAKLPTYNNAQKLAQIAAVNLGRRNFKNTIAALNMLMSHLGSREEWVRFAHDGLE